MNILLIGGNGFVGEALINEALKNNLKVSYLSRNKIKNPDLQSINWIKGDIFNLDNINITEEFDIAIHLVGTIQNKNLYTKLNSESVNQSVKLCQKFNIKKLVYMSAKGGFKAYRESKHVGENYISNSNLDYLIVRPGLMFGTKRITSYFNVVPIKIFSTLGINFFKDVYPLPVDKVAQKVIYTILNKPEVKTLDVEKLK